MPYVRKFYHQHYRYKSVRDGDKVRSIYLGKVNGSDNKKSSASVKIVNNTAKNIAIGAVVGAASTIFPPIVPAYKLYSIANIGKGIYDVYTKSNTLNNVFDKIKLESTKYGSSELSKRLSENEASQTAKTIRLAAESAGIIAQVSKEINVDEAIYGLMLENSIKGGILSGIGNYTSYKVESLTR